MNYVNLTPDVVNIYASGVDGTGADTNENTMSLSVLPSGQIAHVSVKRRYAFTGVHPAEVTFYHKVVEVVGLPGPATDTILIVSEQVLLAVPHRDDVASPGELICDGSGQPIGCVGLYVN